jgi:poly(A) polymerase
MLLYANTRATQAGLQHDKVPIIKKDTAISSPLRHTDHTIAASLISENSMRVVSRLKGAGYEAYLVGGCVRDLLLGREPKDFDVATNAHPEQVEHLFRNCRLIGRRFRLAHVRFGREIVEVATFRGGVAPEASDAQGRAIAKDPASVSGSGAPGATDQSDSGRIVRDNVYGTTLEEDALRRDFTVNALFYDSGDGSVIDYTGGLADLRLGSMRLVGNPQIRYREDPVRMLRAVRFAAKLGFRIHPDSEAPLFELGYLLEDIPSARLFEEVLKLFMGGCAVQTFELMRHYQLFRHLFPQTEASLEHSGPHIGLLTHALTNTDVRIAEDKPVTPAFLFAALLWGPMRLLAEQLRGADSDVQGRTSVAGGRTPGATGEIQAMEAAADMVISRQIRRVAVPKRFTVPMREIWAMQPRFAQRSGKRPLRLLAHPRFRAAYDFLLLRNAAGEPLQELCDWWTELQTAQGPAQETMISHTKAPAPRKRRRRR